MSRSNTPKGLFYLPGVIGLYRFRVRESYLADHAAPMVTARRAGALKLDLALRGLSRRIGSQLGNRDPKVWAGLPISRITYPELYELVRGPVVDAEEAREWIRTQVVYLERERNLLVREDHPHRDGERVLRVLRDDGSGELLDDTDGKTNRYVTLNGTLLASGVWAAWDTPELVFYLAAMMGEAHHSPPPAMSDRGDGEWFRSYEWFADRDGSRRDHVGAARVDFKKGTLIIGKKRLGETGFVQADSIIRNPRDGRTFSRGGSRNTYLNRFETKATAILDGQGITAIPVPA